MRSVSIIFFVVIFCTFGLLPCMCQKPLEYRIAEELPIGTKLGDVFTESGLDMKYERTVLNNLQFSFLSASRYFTISQSGGILRTSKRIDRDVLCLQQVECVLRADVAVRPDRYFQIIRIKVHILDINDNWPAFPKDKVRLTIPESRSPGVVSVLSAARDKDSGQNGIREYKLVSSSSNFRIGVGPESKVQGIKLLLDTPLDREKEEYHQLRIVAYDGGLPQRSGSVIVHITVSDVNDNIPKFSNKTYEVRIYENATIHSKVVAIRASDPDQGLNGQVAYALSPDTRMQYGHRFGIDENTGLIYLKQKLDYQSKPLYSLTAVARDMGPDSIPAGTEVKIHVLDINDHAPKITINAVPRNGQIQIQENSKSETFVAHISVEDLDGGNNAKFSCSLSDTNFHLQHLYGSEYKIVTAAILDREAKSRYSLAIYCRDFGRPPLSSTVYISVTVMDKNDHAPAFSQQRYFATLKENNRIGTTILQVNTTDKDLGKNGRVQYSLNQKSKPILKIHPDTGVIVAITEFDREVRQSVEVTIKARDKGSPPQTSTATLLLTITDDNDEKPRFSQSNYGFHVVEQKPPGTEVGKVYATDPDSDEYNKFHFSLAEDDTTKDVFAINQKTGVITTKAVLYKENKTVYQVVVFATDIKSPYYSSIANVSIYVIEVNGSPPVQNTDPPITSANNLIVILVLSGTLGIMLILLVVILTVCGRRHHRNNHARRYISGNLVRIAHREVDIIRRKELEGADTESQIWGKVLDPPPYSDIEKSGHMEECVPLGLQTSDIDTAEYPEDSNQKRQQKTRRSNSDNLSTCSADVSNTDSGGDTARSKRSQRAGKAPGRCTDTARSAGSTYESINRKRKSPGQRRHKGPKSPHSLNRGAGRPKSRQGGSRDENPESSSDKHKVALVHPQAALVIPRRNAEEMNSDEEPDFYQGGSHSGSDGALHHDSEPEQLDSDVSDDSHQAQQVPKPAPRYIYPNQRSDPQYDAATPPKGYEKLQQRLGADGLSDENVSSGSDEDHIPNLNAGSDEYLSRRNIVV